MNEFHSDLVVLVSDKNMEASVRGLLSRPEALSIRAIQSQVYVHPERDPGCFHRGHDFLRPMVRQYAYAIIMFDRDGCGRSHQPREEIEQIVTDKLSQNGWRDRGAAIVLDPELEIWVWSDSAEVDYCLGWGTQTPDLRSWLKDQKLWPSHSDKPSDPKLALENALRKVRKPRSSAIYEQLARRVSFERCTDGTFRKFKDTLRNWYPSEVIR